MHDCVSIPPLSRRLLVLIVSAFAAAAIASGTMGMMGDALRHCLTCAALAVGIMVYLPLPMKQWEEWVVFVGAIILSLFTQATSNIVINVSAVVLVLLVLAYYSEKSDRAILNTLATVVFLFVLYRFSREAIPSVRQLADGVGSLFGMVSVLWGKSALPIGTTFAGIDLLVLMLIFWAFWAVRQPSPRGKKIFVGLAAILIAQLLYLVVLSFAQPLLDLLPASYYAPEDESNRTGVWVWHNMVRAMIPWNLPALATLFQLFVLGGMVRIWNSAAESAVEEKSVRPNAREPLPIKADARQPIEVWLPAVLGLLFVLSATVSLQPMTLKDKNILANLDGFVSWRKPDFGQTDSNGFGELPLFIESLGGRLSFSQRFTEDELSHTDLVILLHPSQSWTEEEKNRIQDYVSRGGRLLIAADTFRKEGELRSTTNDIAAFSGIQAEQTIAAFLVNDGEQSLETIGHPAVVGLDASHGTFGFQRGSPLHVSWPAGPIVINPWGWSEPALNIGDDYQPNLTLETRLGDLVLAAERSYGSGKVVMLGDVNALSNDRLPMSYEFVGRLLASLAQGTGTSVELLYQGYMLLLSGIMMGLIAYRPDGRKTLVSAAVFAVALVVCNAMVAASASPMPKKPKIGNAFDIAYIDTSHLGRFSERLWDLYRGVGEEGQAPTAYDFGLTRFTRTLMRQGFLPFRMTKFDRQRLADATLTVSMAPAKAYSEQEIEEIKKYVEAGGVFVCMVGAEEARTSESLLNAFHFSIAPMPVYPGEKETEPWPLGAILRSYDDVAPSENVMFYAAWTIRSLDDRGLLNLLKDVDNNLLVAGREMERGKFIVIADTFFASNQNMNSQYADNARYWNYLLDQITDRKPPSDKEDALRERGLE